MTNDDQVARTMTAMPAPAAPARDSWVKPEITSFAAAADAEANGPGSPSDASPGNLS